MEMIYWQDGCPVFLDQTLLPGEEKYVKAHTVEDMARAIETLQVRGAPLIGVSAAYGLALAARLNQKEDNFMVLMERDEARLRRTRPTAVNLFWALDKCMEKIRLAFRQGGKDLAAACALETAHQIKEEDIKTNRQMGLHGQALLEDGDGVLTHCNAGALATAGYGTALGVIRAAVEAGKKIHVYADETRPLLQGSRLTCWELMKDNIPVTLESDGMGAVLMSQGRIQKVIVGADRIACNGDTANKIGTYNDAIAAHYHGVPFYVAAPESTIDRSLPSGEHIPIEMRSMDEMRYFQGAQSAPDQVDAFNPAFDVTPASLIAAIITEKGVYYPTGGKFHL